MEDFHIGLIVGYGMGIVAGVFVMLVAKKISDKRG